MNGLYFIAILTSAEINRDVLEWKRYMLDRFRCKVALRSPAHVTLIPPFRINNALEKEMVELLQRFSLNLAEFQVTVRNFSSFPPRVIFLDVVANEQLTQLKRDIEQCVLSTGLYEVKPDMRRFHPHITIANRDLQKADFPQAWQYFSELRYEAEFMVHTVSLLRSGKAGWEIV